MQESLDSLMAVLENCAVVVALVEVVADGAEI